MGANINEVKLIDTPFQNPWKEQHDLITSFLTSDKTKVIKTNAESQELLLLEIYLSDTKLMRSRTVYDIVTLIAEVSGFADLFVLGFGALIGNFYNPKAIDTEIFNHMKF